MLAYLVLRGRDGAPVDEGLIRHVSDDPKALPFEPEARMIWTNSDRTCVFLGWQAFTDLAGLRSHWAVDEVGLTAFAGHCWPRATGWNHQSELSWAAQLKDWIGTRNILESSEQLYGQFTLISLDANGTGTISTDFGGFDPVFVATGGEVTAVSNRTGLCAQAIPPKGTELQRSLTGAGWLICHGEVFFDGETGYWDVERIPMGAHIAVEPNQSAAVIESETCPLGPLGETATYSELLIEVQHDLRQSIHAIANLPAADRHVALSGGIDSRLLTALIIQEGLQDRFRFMTFGPPTRSDPIVAREIARRFGLDWAPIDRSARTLAEERAEILAHTSLTEGMVNGWNSAGSTAYSGNLLVTGMAGEYLRWGRTSRAGMAVRSDEELIALLRRNIKFDPLGVMWPELLEYYHQTVAHWARAYLDNGETLPQVSSYFNQSGQARNRFAVVQACSETLTLTPYITPTLVRAMQRLPVDQRPNYRFQIDLMRAFEPELARMPFAATGWSAEAVAHLPDAAEYLAIPAVQSAPEGQTWRVLRYDDYRPMLEEFLLDRTNPIHELIDSDRLERIIPTGGRHAGRTRRMWALLTAAIWMGRHETPIRIGRA